MPNNEFCYKHHRYYTFECPECINEFSDNELKLLAEQRKQEKEQKQKDNVNTQKWIEEIQGKKDDSTFEICPDCGHRSLKHLTSLTKKCYNPDCSSNFKSLGDRLMDSL